MEGEKKVKNVVQTQARRFPELKGPYTDLAKYSVFKEKSLEIAGEIMRENNDDEIKSLKDFMERDLDERIRQKPGEKNSWRDASNVYYGLFFLGDALIREGHDTKMVLEDIQSKKGEKDWTDGDGIQHAGIEKIKTLGYTYLAAKKAIFGKTYI